MDDEPVLKRYWDSIDEFIDIFIVMPFVFISFIALLPFAVVGRLLQRLYFYLCKLIPKKVKLNERV